MSYFGRHAGKLLKEMKEQGQRAGVGQPKKVSSHDVSILPEKKLKELGITYKQASDWQRVAAVS